MSVCVILLWNRYMVVCPTSGQHMQHGRKSYWGSDGRPSVVHLPAPLALSIIVYPRYLRYLKTYPHYLHYRQMCFMRFVILVRNILTFTNTSCNSHNMQTMLFARRMMDLISFFNEVSISPRNTSDL